MSDFVIVKLVNDELMMAKLTQSSDHDITLEDPIAIRHVSVSTSVGVEQRTVTHPLCMYTAERSFQFERSKVLFVKELHPGIVSFYTRMRDAFSADSESYSLDDHESPNSTPSDDSFSIFPKTHSLH